MEKITPLNLKNSVVPVKKVIINEEYFNMYSEFDMAILVLEKNVIEFCENVHQIKLITNSKTEYSDCFYVGWGSPYESVNEKTLNINAINDVVLKGDLKMKLAKDQSMLTSKIDGKIKAPCTGDSGGPVLCKNAKGLLDMVGVISETSSSAMPNASNKEFCDKTDMVFASSVQFNYKWLQKIVQSNEGSLRC
uniref:Peptidase S1 domain-containing protein n=1 Tax=Rhabditophanes sp. KR3021 TaxID=114890 RepID=A0AC35TPL0_9BILA